MDDMISRQAAIDAILAIDDHGNSDRANALGLAEFAITVLPSAEPQERKTSTDTADSVITASTRITVRRKW